MEEWRRSVFERDKESRVLLVAVVNFFEEGGGGGGGGEWWRESGLPAWCLPGGGGESCLRLLWGPIGLSIPEFWVRDSTLVALWKHPLGEIEYQDWL